MFYNMFLFEGHEDKKSCVVHGGHKAVQGSKFTMKKQKETTLLLRSSLTRV